MTETLMPAAFLGHGKPMNALEKNRFSATWRAFGDSTSRPRVERGDLGICISMARTPGGPAETDAAVLLNLVALRHSSQRAVPPFAKQRTPRPSR